MYHKCIAGMFSCVLIRLCGRGDKFTSKDGEFTAHKVDSFNMQLEMEGGAIVLATDVTFNSKIHITAGVIFFVLVNPPYITTRTISSFEMPPKTNCTIAMDKDEGGVVRLVRMFCKSIQVSSRLQTMPREKSRHSNQTEWN